MPRSIPPKPPREVVRDRHVRSYPPDKCSQNLGAAELRDRCTDPAWR
jgi:hypothetical protein